MSKTRDISRSIQSSAIIVPSGNTAVRPTPANGYFRFNTDTSSFEGYASGAWGSIGGGSITYVSANTVSDANNISTGYFSIPIGTTAQRPARAPLGAMRWNSSNSTSEIYVGDNNWQIFSSASYTFSYIVVAGGGGGGSDIDVGGGGGGGGVITGTTTTTPGSTYAITVGAGGNQGSGVDYTGTGGGTNGTQGGNSTGIGQTCIGGGYGGTRNTTGGNGGSGGGGGDAGMGGGVGTAGQGYPGGSSPGMNTGSGNDSGGGGGAGSAASGNLPGSGLYYSITGTTYGAGGRGAQTIPAAAGTPNTGNGGTGCRNGGSGVVVIAYPGSQRGSGGVVTSSGGYTIHTFTGSGTYTA